MNTDHSRYVDLVVALAEEDVVKFTNVVKEFDGMTKVSFMSMPLEVCEGRDPKGLYKLARARKIRGISIDVIFMGGLDPRDVSVPVVRGHVVVMVLPHLSQVKPACSLTEEEIK
ncbi:hypothetical protein Tco_0246211 [Tanacetum coccineum]